MTDPEFRAKAPLYKTAYAKIGCAEFPAGACVAVEYSHSNTSHWFLIRAPERISWLAGWSGALQTRQRQGDENKFNPLFTNPTVGFVDAGSTENSTAPIP